MIRFQKGHTFHAHNPDRRAVVLAVQDDGRAADLLILPEGQRVEGMNYAQMNEWFVLPHDRASHWYVEKYERDGVAPHWHGHVPTPDDFLVLLRDEQEHEDRIVRVTAPHNATSADLERLSAVGVQRI
jgi:hypothetical protein